MTGCIGCSSWPQDSMPALEVGFSRWTEHLLRADSIIVPVVNSSQCEVLMAVCLKGVDISPVTQK